MITTLKKSPVALLVAAVIALSACSSSSNSDNDVLEDGQTPSTPADTSGDNLTTDSNGSDTDPVTGVVDKPGVADALPLDQLHDQLIIALAAYPVENLSDEVVLLGETIAVGAAPGTRLADGAFSVIVRDQDVVTPTQKTQYDCPLGGTMTAEIGRMFISESSYSNIADHDSYQFDQCRLATNGEQLLDGTVRTMVNSVSASRGGFDNRDAQWTNFSWQQGNGDLYEGTVLIDINRLLSFDNQEGRGVTIDRFEHSSGDQLKNRIVKGNMTLLNSSIGSGFVQNFQLDAEGQVTTEAGVAVQISTDATLSASQSPAESPDAATPFTGVLSMAADDGGRLVMTAQPIVAFGPKLVDFVFTTSGGETRNLKGEVFPELPILAQ